MKKIVSALTLLIMMSSCHDEIVAHEGACSIPATVIDMSELDGCGYMIKLENGDLLEPIWSRRFFCGTPPLPPEITEDPLYNFEFVDGMHVMINYDIPEEEHASICMAGTLVIITCIEEVESIVVY